MNILFLTLAEIFSIEDRGIYQDLLRKFRDEGHSVYVVTPVERRKKISTNFKEKDGISILQVKTFNIQKTNIVEKGIGTLAIEFQFLHAVKKYLNKVKFDLILYSTPPITFAKVIEFIKNRDNAQSYLLLKDIFPQNAVDMEMIKEGGFIHRQFLKKEKRLYQISDTIGCMSEANVAFLKSNNPEVNPKKIEVNPNSIFPISFDYTDLEKEDIRNKYQIPLDKKVLVYGGNLGKPQGLDFLLQTIESYKVEEIYFLIIGDGTEYPRINNWFNTVRPNNAKLMQRLPKNDYDRLLAACDVGLIFLDAKFLIPNFPSRLLSYLEMGLPVLSATDVNTDIGKVLEESGSGLSVKSGNLDDMIEKLEKIQSLDLKKMGDNGRNLLLNNYTVDNSYAIIMNRMK
ncbi:glycosyltransferase family 4 protein [Sphingobacterium sp. CZ-2]|uniref:glycosyltransferase family 4 protein n=1 Tax=Sphingobacterium sp. CZ-2 TaxID=2557994 RepID=UPI00106FA441|nr:glycosyltransferase family 4 protein [Sphingobacterium sp. CZ-2]QBR13594.1 glycosyltransferase WbuB [Sphingobacterium sp. CZ-2]